MVDLNLRKKLLGKKQYFSVDISLYVGKFLNFREIFVHDLFRNFGDFFEYIVYFFNPNLMGVGEICPQNFQMLIPLEPKVGLTSNQAVNSSLSVVSRSKKKNWPIWTMKGPWRVLSVQGSLHILHFLWHHPNENSYWLYFCILCNKNGIKGLWGHKGPPSLGQGPALVLQWTRPWSYNTPNMALYILALFLHSMQKKYVCWRIKTFSISSMQPKWDQGTLGRQRLTLIGSRTGRDKIFHFVGANTFSQKFRPKQRESDATKDSKTASIWVFLPVTRNF